MHLYFTCTKQKRCHDFMFCSQEVCRSRHLVNEKHVAGSASGDTGRLFGRFGGAGLHQQ